MELTRKERLRRALRREAIDRIPTQINYTDHMGVQLAAHFGIPMSDLPFFLDNHLVRVDISHVGTVREDNRTVLDWWGAGHDTGEEGYYIRHSPLAGSKDLDHFRWPDPSAPGLFNDAKKVIAKHGGEYFIVPNLGFALFERAWSLRGFEQLLLDIAEDPNFVGELLDRIMNIQLVLINQFLKLGVDGGYFGDDYGAQKNMLFSPAAWRRLIKPRLAQLFKPFTERGLPVIMHSDGQIQKILPDLVEIGLTTLNPVQPEVLDHPWLQENFGNSLSFYGGISTQTVLPKGSPKQVEEAIYSCIRCLAPERTGLMVAPSHRLMIDIPLENIEQMMKTFRALSKEPFDFGVSRE